MEYKRSKKAQYFRNKARNAHHKGDHKEKLYWLDRYFDQKLKDQQG